MHGPRLWPPGYGTAPRASTGTCIGTRSRVRVPCDCCGYSVLMGSRRLQPAVSTPDPAGCGVESTTVKSVPLDPLVHKAERLDVGAEMGTQQRDSVLHCARARAEDPLHASGQECGLWTAGRWPTLSRFIRGKATACNLPSGVTGWQASPNLGTYIAVRPGRFAAVAAYL